MAAGTAVARTGVNGKGADLDSTSSTPTTATGSRLRVGAGAGERAAVCLLPVHALPPSHGTLYRTWIGTTVGVPVALPPTEFTMVST